MPPPNPEPALATYGQRTPNADCSDTSAPASGRAPDDGALQALVATAEQRLCAGEDGERERYAVAAPLLFELLRQAIDSDASGLRLCAGTHNASARVRCAGAERQITALSPALCQALCELAARCAGVRRIGRTCVAAEDLFRDARRTPGTPWDRLLAQRRFELFLSHTCSGPTALIRLLNHTNVSAPLQAFGYRQADVARIRTVLHGPCGLIVAGGARGSGRTGALYAMLGEIDPVARSIQTLETRPRRLVPQWIQFGRASGRLRGRRAVHRLGLQAVACHAADVVLLDRIARPSSAFGALQAVRSGRLVLSTMEVSNACAALTQLQSWGVPVAQLVESLSLVINQRPVAQLCRRCSIPDRSDTLRGVLAGALNTWLAGQPLEPRKAAPGGCVQCRGAGQAGSVLIYELIEIDARARGLIASGLDAAQLEPALLGEGRTLWDQGLRSLAQGQIGLDALRAAVREPR